MRPLLLVLLFVPAVVLLWRVVVSKRSWPIRIGAAFAAAATLMGAFVLYGEVPKLNYNDWRDVTALAAAASGSLYLIGWAILHRGNRSHRTFSIVGAIIGLVPFATLYRGY